MSIPAWAVRGQKVVCVDATPDVNGDVADLRRGSTYTIREVVEDAFTGVGLYLDEVTNGLHPLWNEEYGYLIARFRPIVSAKTEAEDVTEFRKLLTHKLPETV